MTKIKKILKSKKTLVIAIAVIILSIVSILAPEYAENVARGFMLLIGVM